MIWISNHIGKTAKAWLAILALMVTAAPGLALQQSGTQFYSGRGKGALFSAPKEVSPRRPFPQHTVYASGTIAPNHLSQATLDAKVSTLYFAWKSRYVAAAGRTLDGHPRFRVRSGRLATDPTVSEGQGYGLMLAAIFAGQDPAARSLFDGLLEFALDHHSTVDARLLDWYVNADESPDSNGDDCAFDGDCDAAFALLLAEAQWGNGGRFNYGWQARSLLDGLMDSAIGPQSNLPMLGDWVSPQGQTYNQWTSRSSDLTLDHFRSFEQKVGDGRWTQVLLASQDLIEQTQAVYSANTGLMPDFLVPVASSNLPLMPAPAGFLEGPWDGVHYYNACRDPWRFGTDALTSGDSLSRTETRRMAQWIRAASGANPFAIRAGYRLNGVPIPGSNYFTTAFVAPFGVAAMTDPASQGFLNAIFDSVVDSDEDYYEDSIALLSSVVMSGNWWQP